MLVSVRLLISTFAMFLVSASLLGCNSQQASNGTSGSSALTSQQQQRNAIRQDLQAIPPPSKTRYLAIRNLSNWENPYLTVNGGMATLHILGEDKNTSELGQGSILRPTGARRQDLDVRLADLPTALNAVPHEAWPYGRVIAVEEAHNVPTSGRPEIRRNMELAEQTLNDVGVVVYEWADGGVGLR